MELLLPCKYPNPTLVPLDKYTLITDTDCCVYARRGRLVRTRTLRNDRISNTRAVGLAARHDFAARSATFSRPR